MALRSQNVWEVTSLRPAVAGLRLGKRANWSGSAIFLNEQSVHT